MWNRHLLLFVLLNLLLGFAQAEENKPFLPENLSELTNSAESDSVKTYYDLIAKENYDSHYGPNVAGMVVGGLLTGAGTLLQTRAFTAFWERHLSSSPFPFIWSASQSSFPTFMSMQ